MTPYNVGGRAILGCGYGGTAPTTPDFGSHFSNYEQQNDWIHLACVLHSSSMDFFYNEELPQSSPISYSPVNPHTSGQ